MDMHAFYTKKENDNNNQNKWKTLAALSESWIPSNDSKVNRRKSLNIFLIGKLVYETDPDETPNQSETRTRNKLINT